MFSMNEALEYVEQRINAAISALSTHYGPKRDVYVMKGIAAVLSLNDASYLAYFDEEAAARNITSGELRDVVLAKFHDYLKLIFKLSSIEYRYKEKLRNTNLTISQIEQIISDFNMEMDNFLQSVRM